MTSLLQVQRNTFRQRKTVRILHSDESRLTYQWTISDTGIGISEEYLNKIFEPFTQEGTDARSVYHGTGLGMSIAKALNIKIMKKVIINEMNS